MALASSLKVIYKDTINFTLDRERLKGEAARLGIDFSEEIKKLFFSTDWKRFRGMLPDLF